MRHCRFLVTFICLIGLLRAAPSASKQSEVESTWPGVRFQIADIKPIDGDRLLFLIRLQATPQAARGTTIGVISPIPPGTPKEDISGGQYGPNPFSLIAAVLTDEQTGKKYPAVTPDPNSPAFAPFQVLTTLSPGGSLVMAVEFQKPPAIVDSEGKPKMPTVSLLLPQAKNAIEKVALPTVGK
jgi:hypothetical protein